MHRRTGILSMLACTAIGTSMQCAAAADSGLIHDRIYVAVGAFIYQSDTKVRVDGSSGKGTPVDLEQTFGLGHSDDVRIDGYWRFAQRHKLRLLYFDDRRSRTRTLDQDVVIGDVTYPANATVQADLRTRALALAYEYAFARGTSYEVAASIGLHNLTFDLTFNGAATMTGANLHQRADADGPLPVIGLHALWQFHPYFCLDAQGQWFQINLGQYDGVLSDYNVSMIWMPFSHAGIGVGYNDFRTRLDVDANSFKGTLRWGYHGPRLFFAFSF